MGKKKATRRGGLLDWLGNGTPCSDDVRETMDRDDRLHSIGPMLIKKVREYMDGMSAREQASGFELEDLVIECWIDLHEKDEKWDRERGAYTTFVAELIHRRLSELRNRTRAVHAPRGAKSRIEDYEARQESASLRTTGRKAMSDIHRAWSMPSDIEEAAHVPWEGDLVSEIIEDDEFERRRAMMTKALRKIPDPIMSMVIRLSYGLGDREAMSPSEIGEYLNIPTNHVSHLRDSGMELLQSMFARQCA